jgi:hypothetical protein
LQGNLSLRSITINGEIPVAQLRDGQTTTLDLSNRRYEVADAIIVASMLKVKPCVSAQTDDR